MLAIEQCLVLVLSMDLQQALGQRYVLFVGLGARAHGGFRWGCDQNDGIGQRSRVGACHDSGRTSPTG